MAWFVLASFCTGMLCGAIAYAWGMADGTLRGRLKEIEFQDGLRKKLGGE